MKEFSCDDVLPGCGARFRAASTAEVEALVHLHARIGHGIAAADMPADITARIRAAIRGVGDAGPDPAADGSWPPAGPGTADPIPT